MNRIQKLDKILNGLLYLDKMRLNSEFISKKIDMFFLDKAQNLEMLDWEMKSIQNELIEDDHIEIIKEELHITQKGKKFIVNKGGYYKKRLRLDHKDLLVELNIKNSKRGKNKFNLSIVVIILSFLSLILAFLAFMKN